MRELELGVNCSFTLYFKVLTLCIVQCAAVQIRKPHFRLSVVKTGSRWRENSPDCVSETSKKEERTDLGQRVSDKSVKWTLTTTAHTASLYFNRKALKMQYEPQVPGGYNTSITYNQHTYSCTRNTASFL